MKKRLSTSLTFVYKYIFPVFFLGGSGIGTILAIPTLGVYSIPFLISFILVFAMCYFWNFRLKTVQVDDDYLYVSNFSKTIQIPLDNIKDVSEIIAFRTIFVEFNDETEFGRKIMFMGYTEMFLFYSNHPAVKEIVERKKITANKTQVIFEQKFS